MSELSLQTLVLAFGYHYTRLVLETDGTITTTEADYLQRHFPREALDAAGFLGEDGGMTPAFEEALREAVTRLKDELPLAERLRIVSVVLRAGVADDRFEPGEGAVAQDVSRLLGITSNALDDDDAQEGLVGDLDLPDPETDGGA